MYLPCFGLKSRISPLSTNVSSYEFFHSFRFYLIIIKEKVEKEIVPLTSSLLRISGKKTQIHLIYFLFPFSVTSTTVIDRFLLQMRYQNRPLIGKGNVRPKMLHHESCLAGSRSGNKLLGVKNDRHYFGINNFNHKQIIVQILASSVFICVCKCLRALHIQSNTVLFTQSLLYKVFFGTTRTY